MLYLANQKSRQTQVELKNKTLQERAKRSRHYNGANLISKHIVKKWCLKALKAFYFLKRNTSTSTKLSAKLNAYAGYVVPIDTYATQAWFANKIEAKEVERVQKKATSLNLNNWELNYKKRLGKFNLIALSLYI